MNIPRTLVHMGFASLLALTSIHSFAQWHWLDDQGRKVFSDRPPGPEVPEKNIIKRPAQLSKPAAIVVPVSDTAVSGESGKTAVPKTDASGTGPAQAGTDKGAAEQAQKLKQEQDRATAAKAQSCAAAQRQMAGLKSGGRIARFNDKGEREFLDDAAKATEMRQAQKVIDADCK